MAPQRAAYSRAGKTDFVRSADWVLIVDADEFLNIHVGDRSIDALIDACGAPDAISINWRLMGSQGQSKMMNDPFTGDLVMERFTRGSNFDEPENGLVWGFKTMFGPGKFGFFGVHRPKWNKKVKSCPAWSHGPTRRVNPWAISTCKRAGAGTKITSPKNSHK
ncbi:glycosyltransferase family 2 protein [Octadecabacter sp.]|nr:glycosyltransferase family 2 protein [Octadecabacter sp.]